MSADIRQPAPGEEIASSLTSGIGLLGSLIGVPLLMLAAVTRGDAWQMFSCGVFGLTLLALFGTSTVYHALPPSRTKQILQLVDHVAIYLLIAGSYTPFVLGVLRGAWGWTLFGLVWGIAALGIRFKTVHGVRYPGVSILLYLLMGWLAVIAIRPLAAVLPGPGLRLLLAGGLLYTAGVMFFLWERVRYHHMVWHFFVLGGSACHFLAVLWYALPGAA